MSKNSSKSNLQTAAELIHGDREQTHGDPSKNLKMIAARWSITLSAKLDIPVALTPDDVCAMMIDLKLARITSNPSHVDSWIDIAGYVGLQDRVSTGT